MDYQTHLQAPEQLELEKKKAELAVLQLLLSQRELDLATLQNELRAFEVRYLRTVGKLYAQLDDLEAQLADWEVQQRPHDQNVYEHAQAARAKAAVSADAIGDAREPKRDEFAPS